MSDGPLAALLEYGRRRPGGGAKLRSQRGRIAQNWWSQRFVDAVERGGDRGRLQRGRTYARAGQVVELRPRPGAVGARVQGSRPRPYLVEVTVRRWTPAEVDAVVATVVENPLLLAPLFEGDVPPGLVDLLAGIGVELLPADAEVTYDCSCPDDGERASTPPPWSTPWPSSWTPPRRRPSPCAGWNSRSCCAASPTRPPDPRTPSRTSPCTSARSTASPGDLPDLGLRDRVPGRTVADDLDELVLGPGAAGTADALRPWYVALAQRPGGQSRA